MNPFDTIKQRIQLNTQSKFWSTTKDIYKNKGFSAFYYSYPTTISMNIPFTALNFVMYESSIKVLNPEGTYNTFIHYICGGLSENGPHKPTYLNTWSSVRGAVGGEADFEVSKPRWLSCG